MIKLCYVEGINEVDTPWFATKDEQTTFFNNHVVWQDDESYYPPYFMNTIRLSSEDIPFNDVNKRVNYCILSYDNKYYYYFVNSVDYITDDQVAITIEMDTIQTYLFNMFVSKPTISRMAIKRWGDDGLRINRNYIRENLSTGNMIQNSKVPLSDGTSPIEKLGWLIVTATDEISGLTYKSYNSANGNLRTSHSGIVTYENILLDTTSYRTNGLYTYLIPYTEEFDKSQFIYVQFGTEEPIRIINPQTTLEVLSKSENVISIKYVPYRLFLDTTMSTYNNMPLLQISSNLIVVNFNDLAGHPHTIEKNWYYFTPFDIVPDSGYYNGFVIDYPNIPDVKENEYIDFRFSGKYPSLRLVCSRQHFVAENLGGEVIAVNKETEIPYSSKFVPAMVDETYMRITIGDTAVTCVAPLHYATNPSGNAISFGTLDGALAYAISFIDDMIGTFGGAIDDPHGTAVINENAMEYTLRTNPWKNYQVTHKGSMITDWISIGAGAVTKVAGVATMASMAGGSSKASDTNKVNYSGMAVTAGSGATDYITGFARYRKVYTTSGRDPKTGRFIPRNIYTYTGGN